MPKPDYYELRERGTGPLDAAIEAGLVTTETEVVAKNDAGEVIAELVIQDEAFTKIEMDYIIYMFRNSCAFVKAGGLKK